MSSGYEAAVKRAALFDREDRASLLVKGRAPRQMLDGLLAGSMPQAPVPAGDGLLGGVATYTAVLTSKGKMITDGRVLLTQSDEAEGFLLDVPAAGREALMAHFRRSLPPRMATVEDVSGEWSVLSVAGPEAAGLLARLALGGALDETDLSGLSEGAWRAAGDVGAGSGLVVMRWADVWPQAYDVLGSPTAVASLRGALIEESVEGAPAEAWKVLRVEAGRPEFGVDMDEDTIPVEAGIHERAIDYGKGCYTGQEVIVRIRDRGHVNRTLRLLRLGDVEPPPPGAELLAEGSGAAAGVVTSAVRSPREGETLALAYVRRGVEAGGLRLGR